VQAAECARHAAELAVGRGQGLGVSALDKREQHRAGRAGAGGAQLQQLQQRRRASCDGDAVVQTAECVRHAAELAVGRGQGLGERVRWTNGSSTEQAVQAQEARSYSSCSSIGGERAVRQQSVLDMRPS
jgi:hypothetical protein